MTKFLLDSGDPEEYKTIASLAKEKGSELWGSTTNPTLVAKKLAGQKITKEEAFALQKKIVLEITTIVPGAVSAEVYADKETSADEMIAQGKDIATWHERVVVKLPTTLEGFRARTEIRKAGIVTNNTLVFSQEQIFAICLHEQIIQDAFGVTQGKWPPFISPFVGRLDDIGVNGMDLMKHGMKIKSLLKPTTWMLEASVRTSTHIIDGQALGTEILTAPAKVYAAFFSDETASSTPSTETTLKPIPFWDPPEELRGTKTIDAFMEAVDTGKLNIQHDLTDKGLIRFAEDWNSIIS